MGGKGLERLDPPPPVALNPLLTPVLGAHGGRVCVTIQIWQVPKVLLPR